MQPIKVIIETERLLIRELAMFDIDNMLELHSDPEVHVYLGNKTITSMDVMTKAINSIRQQYIDYGVGRWAMIIKESNDFIGWTGLELVTYEVNKHKDFYDLGYRLMKKYWGYGYATESAIASLKYAFNTLELDNVYAMADCNNTASHKILEKVGLRFIEKFFLDEVEHNWYHITRDDYKSPFL